MCPPSSQSVDEEYESDYEDDDFDSESEDEADEDNDETSSSTSAAAHSQTSGAAPPAAAAQEGGHGQCTPQPAQSVGTSVLPSAGDPRRRVTPLNLPEPEQAPEVTGRPFEELTARPSEEASSSESRTMTKSASASGVRAAPSADSLRVAAAALLNHVPSAPCLVTMTKPPHVAETNAVKELAAGKPSSAARRRSNERRGGTPSSKPSKRPPKPQPVAAAAPFQSEASSSPPVPRAPPPGAVVCSAAPSRGSPMPSRAKSRQDGQKGDHELDCYLPNKRRNRKSPRTSHEADGRALAAQLPQLPKAGVKEKRLLMAYNIHPCGDLYRGRSAQDRLFDRILGGLDVEDGRWWRC
mmetsp:Transcript_61013/g.145389  ORF Transcript_61013/g.145389 Transcript_61013/m.145389 type:complete len:353 (+) Transcript_61013:144-1202(+)